MNKTEEAISAVKEPADSVAKVKEEDFFVSGARGVRGKDEELLQMPRLPYRLHLGRLVHRPPHPEMFGGKMKSSYRCHDCHTVSISVDWFTDLHIPVPEQVRLLEEGLVPQLEHLPGITVTSTKELKEVATPLESLLEVALCDELLEDKNKYHCDVCNGLRDATRSSEIIQTPNVLILVLLRFKYDAASQCRKKLTSLVEYPDTLTFGGESYSLRNVVVHSGCDSGEGHYYTWARREEATWLVLSDCHVREESWKSFLESPEHQKNDTPYLLFYAKKVAEEELLSSKESHDRGNMDVATDLTPLLQSTPADIKAL